MVTNYLVNFQDRPCKVVSDLPFNQAFFSDEVEDEEDYAHWLSCVRIASEVQLLMYQDLEFKLI